MATTVRSLLHSFERLPESDKRELAAEIMRRSLRFDFPPVSDVEFVKAADEVFQELDRREATDAVSATLGQTR